MTYLPHRRSRDVRLVLAVSKCGLVVLLYATPVHRLVRRQRRREMLRPAASALSLHLLAQ